MTRRGIILLECIIALAIFVAVGLSLLAMSSLATDITMNTQRQAHARDLARSAMAQIEANLASPETLGGEVKDDSGKPTGWALVVHSEPSQFQGLALVEVTAAPSSRVNGPSDSAPVGPDTFTLRSLVNLSTAQQVAPGVSP